jgi:hypothetical protein
MCNKIHLNPFVLSESEKMKMTILFLLTLVREITEVDLDDPDLATRICDHRESSRRSKSSSKKAKDRKRVNKIKQKNMLLHERFLLGPRLDHFKVPNFYTLSPSHQF